MFDDEQRNGTNQDQAPDTLLKEKVKNINGQDIIVTTEIYIKNPDGSYKRQIKDHYLLAADGRWLRPDDFVGFSWTKTPTPKDKLTECMDPFGLHSGELRCVYVGIDGFVTRLGNVLCLECLDYNIKRQNWKRWLFWGIKKPLTTRGNIKGRLSTYRGIIWRTRKGTVATTIQQTRGKPTSNWNWMNFRKSCAIFSFETDSPKFSSTLV